MKIDEEAPELSDMLTEEEIDFFQRELGQQTTKARRKV